MLLTINKSEKQMVMQDNVIRDEEVKKNYNKGRKMKIEQIQAAENVKQRRKP